MRAIPTAAEKPVRNSLGKAKNTGKQLYTARAAQDRTAIEIAGEWIAPKNSKAIPPKATGIPMWYRRSSLRSEWRETRIIPTKPTTLGITTRNPTKLLEFPVTTDFI